MHIDFVPTFVYECRIAKMIFIFTEDMVFIQVVIKNKCLSVKILSFLYCPRQTI